MEEEKAKKKLEEYQVKDEEFRSTPYNNIRKCIVIGDSGIGKSSLIYQLSTNTTKKILIKPTDDTYYFKPSNNNNAFQLIDTVMSKLKTHNEGLIKESRCILLAFNS